MVGFFTLLVKVASLSKELVVAYLFGTGDTLDAFLIAYLVPSFVVLIIAGAFKPAVVPTYIQVRDQESPEAAQELLSDLLFITLALLVAMTALLAAIGPYLLTLLGSGFNEQKTIISQNLLWILLPLVILGGLQTIYSSILNAGESFAVAAYSPAVVPIASILILVLLAPNLGIYSLAIGFLVGFALQVLILALCLKKRKISLKPKWTGMNPAVRQVIDQYLPMAAGAFLISSNFLVDQSMAAMLGSGSVAALSYSNKVTATLLGVGAMALGTAVLPYYSKMVAKQDWDGIHHTLKTYRWKVLQVAIPVTLLLFFLSEPLIRILFERGAFTEADTVLVGWTQAMYVLQIPFYVLNILAVRLVSSLKYNKLLLYGNMISLPLNIILNYLLMKVMGIAGIALSTSLVYAVSFVFLSVGLQRKLNSLRPA
ncbi:MAG: putative lipid II flippase MurJ [Nitrospinaceae bacterium]|nr:MAG: putative lipid II flippase MurJ [Nitrospinaceae bacterium]